MIRPQNPIAHLSWQEHPQVELVYVDLHQRQELIAALTGVEAVIHLAAAKSGTFAEQFAGTVQTTESLLAAMTAVGLRRLVAVSTFSVYEYLRKRQDSLLNEESPLVVNPQERDAYTQTKLLQEEHVRGFATEQGGAVTIARPGMIYGRGGLWHALLGAQLGPIFLRIGAKSRLPLSYVENCAEALVLCAECDRAIGQTLNLVDDDLPTQAEYVRELQKRTAVPHAIFVPWFMMRSIAGFAWWVHCTVLGKRLKLPGILVPAKLHARFKPLRYSNERAKAVLDWQPRYPLQAALDRSCSQDDLLQI
jgi:nucleoside-diphosphate-sugar epimerase